MPFLSLVLLKGMVKVSTVTAVIMAAGKGTRMKSNHAKPFFKVAGVPMIKQVCNTARAAGADKVIVIVGHKKEEIIEIMGDEVAYAEQTRMLGTGDAVKSAENLIPDSGDVIILSGDAPLIREESVSEAIEIHKKSGSSATVFTAVLDSGGKYGRILRDSSGDVLGIVEYKDADESQRAICEINGGMYVFKAVELKSALSKITNNNAQGEYYLTDTLAILKDEGKKIGAYVLKDADEILGVNDKFELSKVDRILRMRINEAHARAGVYFQDIENAFISPEVKIEADAEIYTGTILDGKTYIEAGCKIGPNSHITNSVIHENAVADNAVIIDSEIGSGTKVGPFTYVRPGSKIGSDCKIGDFVEIKNSTLGNGTKVSHLTYIGDSDVGEKVNFGCGTVTSNYDGKKKYRTVIGNRVFIGCNTNLVSPVTVGDDAYIAAGSTITDEVPGKTLAIARARQVVKKDWKDKREI